MPAVDGTLHDGLLALDFQLFGSRGCGQTCTTAPSPSVEVSLNGATIRHFLDGIIDTRHHYGVHGGKEGVELVCNERIWNGSLSLGVSTRVSFGGMGVREKLTVSAFLDCVHGSGLSGSLKTTVEGRFRLNCSRTHRARRGPVAGKGSVDIESSLKRQRFSKSQVEDVVRFTAPELLKPYHLVLLGRSTAKPSAGYAE